MGLKKGQTNNPNGRPKKGQTITDILNMKLDKEVLCEKINELIKQGDINAIKLAMSYIDGMPVQKNINENIEVSSPLAEEIKKLRENK